MSFPEQTTITQNTATLTCEISGKTSGKVAAFYNGDLRTPSGGNSITNNPVLGKFVADCNISFQGSETGELSFTIKWMDTSTGDIYVCSPDYAITAGDVDGGFPGSPIVFTASSTPEGGGGTVAAPTASGTFTPISSLTQGTSATTTEAHTDVFTGDNMTFSHTVTGSGVTATASNGKVQVTASGSASPGTYTVTVTATNAGGTATATISVTVVAANQAPTTTGIDNIRVGTSSKDGELLITYKDKFDDSDGTIANYSFASDSTNFVVSESGEQLKVTVAGGLSANTSGTITITATDDDGATVDLSFTVTVEAAKAVYVYTTKSGGHTTLNVSVTGSNTLAGMHLKYTNSSSTAPSYIESDQTGNGPTFAEKSFYYDQWNNHQYINPTVGTPYMVFFDQADKALAAGDYDFMYFANIAFDVDIVGLADKFGNMYSVSDISNQSPPVIFVDTTIEPISGYKYGDVNVDDEVDATDVTLLSQYLVGDNESGAITTIESKIAAVDGSGTYVSILDPQNTDANGKPFAWIDLNGNDAIDIGDLCRIAEYISIPDNSYSMISNRSL